MSPLIIIPVSMLWINNGKKWEGELWTKEQDGYKGGPSGLMDTGFETRESRFRTLR